MNPRALLRLSRPRQWAKNVLVVAAPGAAGVLDEPSVALDTVIAFVALCLAASGTYWLNDAADVEADRAHPDKRTRPVAAGEVSVRTARVGGAALIAAGVLTSFATGQWELALVVGGYAALTTAYSLWLKHVAVVDVVTVAAGFVIRAIAGAVATDVPISDWFFIVASFGSLFMVTGKREAEMAEMADEGHVRATLEAYTPEFLRYLRAVASGTVLVAYSLFAFDKADLADGGFPWFQLSILPFVMGLLRYALLLEEGQGGAPEEIVLSDRPLQIIGVAFVATFAAGVYLLDLA